jgi:predicted nuclease with TOPRIM domain
MSVEIHDSLIALLSEVAALKEKEGGLKSERQRQEDAIAAAESEVSRCNGELDDVRENQLRLRRQMDGLRDVLFAREDEGTIVMDETNTPTDGEHVESEGHQMWKERQKQLRSVP